MIGFVVKTAVLWLFLFAIPASAQTCRQALVLGLDVSLSVNSIDFNLQREGLARALTDDAVVAALLSAPGDHVELAIFDWSGQSHQTLLVDWTVINSRRKLATIAMILRESSQGNHPGRTGLGASMLFARDLLSTRGHCTNWTLDISGDGPNNNGVLPELARGELDAVGIVVNALVIGTDKPNVEFGEFHVSQLARYFRDNVIVGPSAFVETIIGFDHYAVAIKRKLLRELSPSFVLNSPRTGEASLVKISTR